VPNPFELALLDRYQRNFPLDPAPFARIAEELGSDEGTVIAAYQRLEDKGYISRIGAVVRPHRRGWSTLAAMSVPEERLEEVAEMVSAYAEVNHNYEREHELNLWFVVTGPDQTQIEAVLAEIGMRTDLDVIDLPLEAAYRVDLGFSICEVAP
jgi:DNA-binding Lrp family transcriptional regulator